MLVAVDTNILVYSAGFNDDRRRDAARALLATITPDNIVVPAQTVGEFYHALTGKFRIPRDEARGVCGLLRHAGTIVAATNDTFEGALGIAASHRLQFWDALILSTAADAGCAILLSEDMQHGFVHRGVTVIDPFVEPMHPLLADALVRRR